MAYTYTLDDQGIMVQISVFNGKEEIARTSSTKEHAKRDAEALVHRLTQSRRKEQPMTESNSTVVTESATQEPAVAAPKGKKAVSKKSTATKKESAMHTATHSSHSTKKSAPAKKAAPAKRAAPDAEAKAMDAKKIKVLLSENPHREGTTPYKVFELLQKAKTVGDFVKAVHSHKIGDGSRTRAMQAINFRTAEKHIKLS